MSGSLAINVTVTEPAPVNTTTSVPAGWSPLGLNCSHLTALAANGLIRSVAVFQQGAYQFREFSAVSLSDTTLGYWVLSDAPTDIRYAGRTGAGLEPGLLPGDARGSASGGGPQRP